jgi:hypothetical protein
MGRYRARTAFARKPANQVSIVLNPGQATCLKFQLHCGFPPLLLLIQVTYSPLATSDQQFTSIHALWCVKTISNSLPSIIEEGGLRESGGKEAENTEETMGRKESDAKSMAVCSIDLAVFRHI